MLRSRTTLLLVAPLLLAAIGGAAWVTRDTRPVYGSAALPAIGSSTDFRIPLLDGDTLRSGELREMPTVLAFWSLSCGVSARALAGIERLHVDFKDRVRVIVLSDDGDRAAVRTAMRDAGITTPVGLADGTLQTLFDRSRTAPERATYRVKWAMPGFLVLDASGRVAHREVGLPLNDYQSGVAEMRTVRLVLDSLLERGVEN